MKDKFPLVVGLGATGSSLIDYLSNFHEEIFLIEDWESNPNLEGIYQKESQININPLLDEDMCEMVSKVYPSPGVSKDHEIFNFATKNEIPISSDIQEFLENNNSFSTKEWKELYRLSEETFVEETESLKKGAAGAGLTDND